MLSILIDRLFEALALFVLIVITIIAYTQTAYLDIKADTILRLDDILLLITIPVVFVELIFSLAPALENGTILQVGIAMLRAFDVTIQTSFIIDGQRRKRLQNAMPGRQFVIFLAIGIWKTRNCGCYGTYVYRFSSFSANMALWIHQTFSGRTTDAHDERYTNDNNR